MNFGEIYFHQPDDEMYIYMALTGRHQTLSEPTQRIVPMMLDPGACHSTISKLYLNNLIAPLLDTKQHHDYTGAVQFNDIKSDLYLAIEVFEPIENIFYSFPLYLMMGEPVEGIIEIGELFEQYVKLRLNLDPKKALKEIKSEFESPAAFSFRENSLLGRDFIRAANISVSFNIAAKKLELIRPILPSDDLVGVAESDYPHPTKPSYIDDSKFKPVSWKY